MQLVEGRDAMNSKELNVNVPLATVESDSEEFEVKISLKVFFHEKVCLPNRYISLQRHSPSSRPCWKAHNDE
jgi:hypothetical protein